MSLLGIKAFRVFSADCMEIRVVRAKLDLRRTCAVVLSCLVASVGRDALMFLSIEEEKGRE